MRIFTLLLAIVMAACGSAAAAVAPRMAKFPVRVNGFSDYCSSYSLDQKGDVLHVSGDCSSEPNGAHMMGAALFTSHINIDLCLRNDDGNLIPKANGGALGSCQCDVGVTLCDNCNGTSLQCSCLNRAADDRKVTLTDMNQFLGIGLDDQGRVVLYCDGVYGEWNQCVKNGAKTDCPPVLR